MFAGHTLKHMQMLVHPQVTFSLFPSPKLQTQKTSKSRAGIVLETTHSNSSLLSFSPNGLVMGQDVPEDMQTTTKLGLEAVNSGPLCPFCLVSTRPRAAATVTAAPGN